MKGSNLFVKEGKTIIVDIPFFQSKFENFELRDLVIEARIDAENFFKNLRKKVDTFGLQLIESENRHLNAAVNQLIGFYIAKFDFRHIAIFTENDIFTVLHLRDKEVKKGGKMR